MQSIFFPSLIPLSRSPFFIPSPSFPFPPFSPFPRSLKLFFSIFSLSCFNVSLYLSISFFTLFLHLCVILFLLCCASCSQFLSLSISLPIFFPLSLSLFYVINEDFYHSYSPLSVSLFLHSVLFLFLSLSVISSICSSPFYLIFVVLPFSPLLYLCLCSFSLSPSLLLSFFVLCSSSFFTFFSCLRRIRERDKEKK